jgi:ATP-dependent Clp protease adaptor protein ClpS
MGLVTCTPEESTMIDELVKELISKTKVIILYNDDHNTFPHVIKCLMKYCGHAMIQAEQCAMIVHSNGKTDIKHGDLKKLKPIYEALQENGLSVKIEE